MNNTCIITGYKAFPYVKEIIKIPQVLLAD